MFEPRNDDQGNPLIQQVFLPKLQLCCGHELENVRLGFCVFGQRQSNPLIVLHPALTGSARAVVNTKPSQGDGWFSHCIGEGKMLDTRRFTIVCFDHLGGNGASTSAAELADFKEQLCFQDEVNLIAEVLSQNNITSIAAVLGGSIGGGQALDWLLQDKVKVGRIIDVCGHATNDGLSKEFFEIQRDLLWGNLDAGANVHGRLQAHLSDQLGKAAAYDFVFQHICDDLQRPQTFQDPMKLLATVRKIGFLRFVTPLFFQTRWRGYYEKLGDQDAAFAQIESWISYQGSSFPQRFSGDALAQLAQLDVSAVAKDAQLVAQKLVQQQTKLSGFAVEGDILFMVECQRDFYNEVRRHLGESNSHLVDFVVVQDFLNGHDHFLTDAFLESRAIVSNWLAE